MPEKKKPENFLGYVFSEKEKVRKLIYKKKTKK
jgi:hypothetical protein